MEFSEKGSSFSKEVIDLGMYIAEEEEEEDWGAALRRTKGRSDRCRGANVTHLQRPQVALELFDSYVLLAFI